MKDYNKTDIMSLASKIIATELKDTGKNNVFNGGDLEVAIKNVNFNPICKILNFIVLVLR